MKTSLYLYGIVTAAIIAILFLAANGASAERLPAVDNDFDGMDDNWEGSYGLDNSTNDAGEDLDEDGMSNIEEYRAFTDPTKDSDSLMVRTNRALIFVGVGLGTGGAFLSASVGIGIAGCAAAGVLAERPDKFGKLLVYQAMPMTQGIYALIVCILVLNFTGLVGGPNIAVLSSPYVGWGTIGIGITLALGMVSSVPQGMTSASSSAAFGRNHTIFGRGLILIAMSETMAIFSFLMSIFLLVACGILG